MKRRFVLTAVVLSAIGLLAMMPAWRLNADEPRPARQGERPDGFRGRGRPGLKRADGLAMRDEVLRRFDEMLDRLARIERRLDARPPQGGDRPGPRPPQPEWLGGGEEGLRPRPGMPRGPRREGGRFGGPQGAFDLPEEVRERIEERMQQGRERMEEFRDRMAAAREKFLEMQERIERLEAEVERLKNGDNADGEG